MKKNMSNLDRTFRVLLAVVVGIGYWQGFLSGTAAIILGVIALVFLATSFVSYCPIYGILGWRTLREKFSGEER